MGCVGQVFTWVAWVTWVKIFFAWIIIFRWFAWVKIFLHGSIFFTLVKIFCGSLNFCVSDGGGKGRFLKKISIGTFTSSFT